MCSKFRRFKLFDLNLLDLWFNLVVVNFCLLFIRYVDINWLDLLKDKIFISSHVYDLFSKHYFSLYYFQYNILFSTCIVCCSICQIICQLAYVNCIISQHIFLLFPIILWNGKELMFIYGFYYLNFINTRNFSFF